VLLLLPLPLALLLPLLHLPGVLLLRMLRAGTVIRIPRLRTQKSLTDMIKEMGVIYSKTFIWNKNKS
jgi:hypothetical protein